MKSHKPNARAAGHHDPLGDVKADPSDRGGAGGRTWRSHGGGSLCAADAAQLMERMQRRTEERRRVEARLGEREERIKAQYANAPSAASFNKDARLAELITGTKASFFKLDRELSENHHIATQRLHSAVFAHATDFLQLFRDVNRASTLVESLKGRVMGTKAAISAISKFSACSGDQLWGQTVADASDLSLFRGNTGHVSGALGASSGSGGVDCASRARARPSLVMQLTRRGNATADILAFNARSKNMDGSFNGTTESGRGNGGATSGCIYLSATTRALNTPSVRLWRDATLVAGGGSFSLRRHRQPQVDADRNLGTPSAQDIVLFADVMKEEVMQVMAGRRYLEAAELLRGMEGEAVAKGCLPLFLGLEAVLVHAIQTQLHRVPMPFMYSESLHIPLIQLLLRFGRVLSGTQVFFQLHTAWVDANIDNLQQRIGSFHGALIATDFLVAAMQEVLQRQRNLWHTLSTTTEVHEKDVDDDDVGGVSEKGKGRNMKRIAHLQTHGVITTSAASPLSTTTTVTTNTNKTSDNCGDNIVKGSENVNIYPNKNGKGGTSHTNENGQSPTPAMPLSSTAVLWVQARVDKLAREVLESRALSYGIGAEGGDPSRFRRAVVMAADAIRTLRRMDQYGYAGCDTHLLRLLTPSLVYLQADFGACTESRLESTGKAMMEHLIQDVLYVYKSCEATYSPKMCEEVARRSNQDCRGLHVRLKAFPRTSYALLLELLLAPASSSLFAPLSKGGGSGATSSSLAPNQPMKMLPPDQYAFLRYVNGCTRVHGLLLSSLIRFVAAMTGREWLPSEHTGKQQKQQELEEGESRESRLECVFFLLSNAVVTESLDTTMQRLFFSCLHTILRQRRTLVDFLRSAEFTSMHRQLFQMDGESSSSSPCISTRWLLGAMQLLLADVLSASVWVAFLSRGEALSYMLCDATLAFRSQYLEELRRVLPRIAQGWMAATLSLAHNVNSAHDLLVDDDDGGGNTAAAEVASCVADGNRLRDGIAQLQRASTVNEERLMPFLLHLVRRPFTALTDAEREAVLLCTPALSSSFSSSSLLPEPPVWHLRGTLGNYPQFPIGDDFDHDDELFLFHWCVQISLNTLAFFQEYLLLPSHVVNERWAMERTTSDPTATATGAARYPLRGCVSPQEESMFGMLSAGGGNYVSSVAILQFVVFRLLRDVLCRAEIWSSMYGLPTDEWSRSKSILRQQLFFFALFVRFWSPLFVGSTRATLQRQPATTNRNGNVDGLPALVILQWLTCMPNGGKRSSSEEEQTQRRSSLDVEDLAFPSNIAASSAAVCAAQVADTWRSQKDGNKRNPTYQKESARERTSSSFFSKNSPTVSFRDGGDAAAPNGNDKRGDGGFSVLLLDVIGSFFDSLQEPRAIPAIMSEVTKSRVEKLLTAVILTDFVGKRGFSDDSDDSDETGDSGDSDVSGDDTDESSGSENGGSAKRPGPRTPAARKSAEVTLLHVHNLLVHYMAPLL